MREIKFEMYCNGKMYSHEGCITQGLDPRTTKKINDENCHWREYTGLKDKNGKEIYEGDIVTFIDYKTFNFTGIVGFDNGSFMIKSKSAVTHYRWLDYEIEIIGNVHENPELL